VANLSKKLLISFYQNRSSIVEVMIKKFWCVFLCLTVYCIAVPAMLNEAVPAAMRDVENELKTVIHDASRYTGNGTLYITVWSVGTIL